MTLTAHMIPSDYFSLLFSNHGLKQFPLEEVEKLASFSGVIYSSPEVFCIQEHYVETNLFLFFRCGMVQLGCLTNFIFLAGY